MWKRRRAPTQDPSTSRRYHLSIDLAPEIYRAMVLLAALPPHAKRLILVPPNRFPERLGNDSRSNLGSGQTPTGVLRTSSFRSKALHPLPSPTKSEPRAAGSRPRGARGASEQSAAERARGAGRDGYTCQVNFADEMIHNVTEARAEQTPISALCGAPT